MDYQTATPEELLHALEWSGRAPDLDLIRAALGRPDELTPGLLPMLAADPLEHYPDLDDDDPRSYADIHAGLLLIAYREEQALPIFAQLFRNPEREHLLEWFDTEFHHYGPLAVPMLLDLAQDEEVYERSRTATFEILSQIGRQHPETRDAIRTTLRSLLPALKADGSLDLPPHPEFDELWSWVTLSLADLQDTDSQPQVMALYDADLMDEFIAGDPDDYLQTIKEGPRLPPHHFDLLKLYDWLHKEEAQERKWLAEQEAREAAQREAAARLRDAPRQPLPTAAATPAHPKVGRNDPCPCGSGLKYKKCHGRPGA